MFWTAAAVVTTVHLNLSMSFVVSNFLSAKVSSEWRLNLDFGTHKNIAFPLNRGVPSIEVTKIQRLCEHFFGTNFCPLNGVSLEQRCPKGEVPLHRTVISERFL